MAFSTIPPHSEILDIGGSAMHESIKQRLHDSLYTEPADGKPRVLPDELLYDDAGLAIWADIIFTKEFYQTADEITLFEMNSDEIAQHIPINSIMTDLGAGDLRKVERLLAVLERRGDKTDYLALDISKTSLETNLAELAPKHENVTCGGLWGDFGAGNNWVAGLDPSRPRVLLSLGSVLFNNETSKAIADLKHWVKLLRPQDLILAGMDGHSIKANKDKVWAAYHSHPDLFNQFWSNGFEHANRLLGGDILNLNDWEVNADLDENEHRHRWFFTAKRDIRLSGPGFATEKTLPKGTVVEWFDAHKQNADDVRAMCSVVGLEAFKIWKAPDSEMTQYLLRPVKGRESSPNDTDSAITDMQ